MRSRFFSILPLIIIVYAALTGYKKYIVPKGDGPYIFYKKGHIYTKYVIESNESKTIRVDSFEKKNKKDIVIMVSGDEPGDSFSVKLKPCPLYFSSMLLNDLFCLIECDEELFFLKH